MGERLRAKDWSTTPLGRPETWSPSIKTAVSICLNSRFPILLWLGPELRLVYNDAYIPFLGEEKHPAVLGAPGREAWGEIWSRPGLDRRTRSCITITALVATGREHELAMHVRAALRNGVTADEIKEILLHCAVYCGVPAANGAFAIAQRVLEEDGHA